MSPNKLAETGPCSRRILQPNPFVVVVVADDRSSSRNVDRRRTVLYCTALFSTCFVASTSNNELAARYFPCLQLHLPTPCQGMSSFLLSMLDLPWRHGGWIAVLLPRVQYFESS